MEIFSQSLKRLRAFLDLEFKGINIMPIVQKNQQLDNQIIQDFEEIFNWLEEHVEVKFISLIFHIDETSIPSFESEKEYLNYRTNCKNLFDKMNKLPQVIITDFKGSFISAWCEFIYHTNYSVAHQETTFHWNHLKTGVLPFSSMTNRISTNLKNIILTSQTANAEKMHNINYLNRFYNTDNEKRSFIGAIKRNIFESSPTGAIQLKHAFTSENQEDFEHIIHYTYMNTDWQRKEKFSSVHEMKELLQNRVETEH